MSKRSATKQISKNDDPDVLAEASEDVAEASTVAPPEKLAQRVIYKAKRRNTEQKEDSAAAPSSFPVFNFFATPSSSAATDSAVGSTSQSDTNGVVSEQKLESTSASSSTAGLSSSLSSHVNGQNASPNGHSQSGSSILGNSAMLFGTSCSFFNTAALASVESFSSVAASSSTTSSFSFSTAPLKFDHTDASANFSTSAAPKEDFKGKAPEPTGEEDEENVFKIPVSAAGGVRAFQLQTAPPKPESSSESGSAPTTQARYVECGRGELRLNRNREGKPFARVLMRADKTHRVVLNSPIIQDMKFNLQDDKYLRFASIDTDGKVAVYLLKFANKAQAQEAFSHMDALVKYVSSNAPPSASATASTSSSSTSSSVVPPASDRASAGSDDAASSANSAAVANP